MQRRAGHVLQPKPHCLLSSPEDDGKMCRAEKAMPSSSFFAKPECKGLGVAGAWDIAFSSQLILMAFKFFVGVALCRTLQQDVQVTSSSQPFRQHALDSPTDRKDLQGMQWRQGHVQQPAFQPTRIGQAVPTDRKDSPTWQGML